MRKHWQRIEVLVEALLECDAKGFELQRFFERDRVVSHDTLCRLRGTKPSTAPQKSTLQAISNAIANPTGPFRGCVSQKVRQCQRHLHSFATADCLDYIEGHVTVVPTWEEIALNALVRLEPPNSKRIDHEAVRLELKRLCARHPSGTSPVLFDEKRDGDMMRCQYIVGPRGIDAHSWDYVRTIYYGHQFDDVERDAIEERIGTLVLSLSIVPSSLWKRLLRGSSLLHSKPVESYAFRANTLQQRFLKDHTLAKLIIVFSEIETREFLTKTLLPSERELYFRHLQVLSQAGMELRMIEAHRAMPAADANLFSMALTFDGMATADQLTVNSPERSVIVTNAYSEEYRTRKLLFDTYRGMSRRIDGYELQAHMGLRPEIATR